MISAYVNLFDDWELLDAALNSIAPMVDEIVVVDGAYKWMTPFFARLERDPTKSVDNVYDVLSKYSSKVRTITGIWDNELHKRMAGFDACRNRYVFRHDADEVITFHETAMERFFRSGLGVAEMDMPTVLAPGWINADNHDRLQRQSCLFDSNLVNAKQHLSHLWLILPPEEAAARETRDTSLVYRESIAFNAHLTCWRPPATSVNRARFYVLNFIRSSGTLPWLKNFAYGDGVDFSDLFDRIAPADFQDILRGDPIVAAPPDLTNGVVRAWTMTEAQRQALAPLWAGLHRGLAALNDSLAAEPRAMARGSRYYMDITTAESLGALVHDDVARFDFSDQLTAAEARVVSLGSTEPYVRTDPLDVQFSGSELSVFIPPFAGRADALLRRAICISAWGAAREPIMHFRLLRGRAADQTPAPLSAAEIFDKGGQWRLAGRFDEADALLSEAIERFPDIPWLPIQYATVSVTRRDWAQAVTRWNAVLARFPLDVSAMVGLGEALREQGDLDAADDILSDAVDRYPDSDMPFIHHAWVSVRRKDWTPALERWRAMLARFPNNPYALAGIVEALLELGDMDAAEASVGGFLMRSPDDSRLIALETIIRNRQRELRQPTMVVAEQVAAQGIALKLPEREANPEVLIEITSICNFACTYCVSSMELREKKEMSIETFRDVMAQVAKITTKPICLHVDGEPTSHPRFKEMALLVNSHGLPIWLATNGSHLEPDLLEIRMDPLISMSTLPEELAKRHSKLDFDAYIARIARYASAWAESRAPQSVAFQIIHYHQESEAANREYKRRKDAFLVEFCRRAGLNETCFESSSVHEDAYRLMRKTDGRGLTFIKQIVSKGGLYPADGKFVERERATAGFCDAPWRQLVVHSNGTLGACCVDLSGGTSFATAHEVATTSLKELWESSPRIQSMRRAFLEGKVEREVCQRCLKQGQVAFAPR
jgi:tetratricopeptide (TPR) repeat protein/organic radical activating enzyme